MTNKFIETNCKRCNRPLTTTAKSITGADDAKAEFGEICQRCVTPNEHMEMLREQGKAIRGIK